MNKLGGWEIGKATHTKQHELFLLPDSGFSLFSYVLAYYFGSSLFSCILAYYFGFSFFPCVLAYFFGFSFFSCVLAYFFGFSLFPKGSIHFFGFCFIFFLFLEFVLFFQCFDWRFETIIFRKVPPHDPVFWPFFSNVLIEKNIENFAIFRIFQLFHFSFFLTASRIFCKNKWIGK